MFNVRRPPSVSIRWCPMRYVAGLCLVLIAGWIVAARGEETHGRIVVKVTEEGTGEPVRGATVHAHLGISEPMEVTSKRITDASGKCELAVPWGNLRLSTPMPPAGYWMAQKMFGRLVPQESLVVTRAEPIIERSFTATKGVVWPVKVMTVGGKPLAGARPHAMGRTFGSGRGGIDVTDAMGEGLLTLPPEGGDVQVHCSFEPNLTELPRPVTLQIEPGFDHKNVVRQARAAQGDRIEIFDDQGRKVSYEGCRIAIRDRTAQIVLEVPELVGPSMAVEVAGHVVDHTGQPIKDATVIGGGYGLPTGEYSKQTDDQGAFRLRGLVKWSPPGEHPAFPIMVTKDGYAGARITQLFDGTEGAEVELKDPIVLKPGYSARVQVLGEDGRSVEGAWAEYNSRGFQTSIPKTDAEGFCTIPNLPEGKTGVRFSYGEQGAGASIEVGPATSQAPATIIRLKKVATGPLATASRQRPRRKPLAVGQAAPEWSISQWTDGKQHSLAALRGKVVVVEFWDIGCGPCRRITMPVSSAMEPKYAKDVAFVHIHPATEEPKTVQEWLATQPWNLLVGFDEGTSPTDSTTLKRYGVEGFPTEFIVARNGRVVDNGDLGATAEERLAKMRVLAEEAELPWPLEKDASEEETIRRMQRFHEHWMTKRIEAALAEK